MALTPTYQVPLYFKAPDFRLPDVVSGREVSLHELKSDKATVVMFICNHCPYVKHVLPEIVRMANEYIPKGVAFIAINANDVQQYPEDSPEKMKTLAEEKAFPFPYLYDESQEVAKAYQAACTPDFNLFDGNLSCIYRGRLDGSSPGNNVPLTGEDLRNALDKVLSGKPVSENQIPSVGCNIKWKA